MDKSLYLAMSGAAQTLNAMAIHANNLANVSTNGFEADLEQARSMQLFGQTYPSRVYAMIEEPSTNTNHGAINTTGNALDVVVSGQGWLAVQAPDGSEAYTRAGDFHLGVDGVLRNGAGFAALGSSGKPIVVPNAIRVQIGNDGTISYQSPDAALTGLEVVDNLKMVTLDPTQLHKGTDGLMHVTAGSAAPVADPSLHLNTGVVESSNVSAVGELARVIELSRQFEMQVKFMQDAQNNDQSMARIMQVP
ncbi:MAG: flagellar basal body rod protein FlgF [Pseudomonadales bacterium]|nr:flagellar basal body rod protein FlgF [Pseudomonadales bacterium]